MPSNAPPSIPEAPTRESAPCPSCGRPVECGARLGLDRCWCGSMPHVLRPPDDPMAACYCEECLRALIASDSPGGGAARS